MVLGKVLHSQREKMVSLFRPWTEESIEKTDFPSLYSEPMMREETEAWLADKMTTEKTNGNLTNLKSAMESSAGAGGDDREVKYKSVKEHMRRRSEKYLMKRLKATEESKSEVTSAVTGIDVFNPWDCLRLPELAAGQTFPPPTCFPGMELVPGTTAYGYPQGSEFVDAALSHGFPPNLFEEYARFLTEQQKQVADRTRKQRPKKFRCPHCQVGFSNNGQLKGHIRIHTGERPFKCDAKSCGKSFTRNEELTRHRRIHSGLRPFPCPECGKRFGRKDHLKKHVKTHFQQRYQLVPILPGTYPYLYGL